MGVVLRAWDPELHRPLAVKVLQQAHAHRPGMERRFHQEVQITGQLQHPGIPPIHEGGVLPDGRPFFAMKLIEGQTLAELLRQRRQPAEGLLRLLAIFGQVCQTLAYAHSKGVIHRDLKPSNVMVGAFGEVQVMDWGIAKPLTADCSEAEASTMATLRSTPPEGGSRPGTLLGTPAYMAPEQARGEVDRLDERCDVFGLGAILCELLTGKPPRAGDRGNALQARATGTDLDATLARLDGCGADAELVGLARACLSIRREDRPRDAGVVAQALADYQAGVQERLRAAERERAAAEARAEEARATARAERARMQAERQARQRMRAFAVAVVLLIGVGSWVAWTYSQRRLAAQREVRDGVTEVRGLLRQGWEQTDDAEVWKDTLDRAQDRLGHLEGLAQRGEVSGPAAADVQGLRAEMDQDRAAQTLAADLERLRLEHADQVKLPQGRTTIAAAFHRVLAEHGLDVLGAEAGAAGALVRGHRLQERLVDALWEWWGFADEAQSRQLEAVLAAADPEARNIRTRFQRQLRQHDRAALQRLLEDPRTRRLPPAALVNLARGLRAAGAHPSAEALLRAGLAGRLGDFWLNEELGMLLASRKPPQGDEAACLLTAAVALRPRSALAHNNLALALHARGDRAAAIRCYRRAIDLDPQNAVLRHNLGVTLRDKGDMEGAIRCFNGAIERDPRYSLAHYDLGNALRDRGDLDAAIRCFNRAIDLTPRYSQAYNNLGTVLKVRGDAAGAIRCFNRAIELDTQNTEAHNNLGNALHDKGDVEGAIRHYNRAIAIDSQYAPSYCNLGRALHNKRDVEGAIRHYSRAIDLDPKLTGAHFNLGNALWDKKDVAGAIRCYNRVIDLNPRDSRGHYSLGNALRAKGDTEGAIRCFRKAIDLDPQFVYAHNNLGNALRDRGDLPGAIRCFRRVIELDPKDSLGHYHLGNALRARGDGEEAIRCYRKATELDPKLVYAHNNLGNALRDRGDLEEAIRCINRAIELDPQNAVIHHNLGVALRARGELAGAIRCYRRAIELNPTFALAHNSLGESLLQRGELAAAQQATRRCLDLLPPQDPLRAKAQRQFQHCDRCLVLDKKLPAILKGEQCPASPVESLELAQLCHRYKQLHGTAARLYADAFAAEPKLADDLQRQHRYSAACSAVLAAASQAVDARLLPDKAAVLFRLWARSWLDADLKAYAQIIKQGNATTRQAVQQRLAHWQNDPSLASVRDREALDRLAEEERAAWQRLWREVEALRKRVAGKGSQSTAYRPK
jgi:tetratricopeptide (TPR) repeat protein